MPKEIDFKKLTEVIKNELKEQGIEFVDQETQLTTEFERNYAYMRYGQSCVDEFLDEEHIKTIKEEAKKILEFARQELQPEIDEEINRAYNCQDKIVFHRGYEKGHKECIKETLDNIFKKIVIEDIVEDKRDSLDLEMRGLYAFDAYRDGIKDTLKEIRNYAK